MSTTKFLEDIKLIEASVSKDTVKLILYVLFGRAVKEGIVFESN